MSWHVTPITENDRDAITGFIAARWATPRIVTRARIHDAGTLPGWLVRDGDRLVGVVTISVEGPECEIVTIDVADGYQGRKIGSAMLTVVEQAARDRGCDRIWLVTTNDNLRGVWFYQIHGYRILAVHRDAVARSREIKPEIPVIAYNGIPVLDELELEKIL